MKWSRIVALMLVVVVVGVAGPAVASEDERADEIRESLHDLIEHSEPDVRAAAVVVVGHIGTSEQQERLEEFKHSDHAQERLAAGAALVVAGESGELDFLVEQLLEASSTYAAIQTVSNYLDDDQLLRVVDSAVDEADSGQRRDLFRFLAGQTGALYQSLSARLTDGDTEVRQAAHEAVVYTAGETALDVADGLRGNQNAEIREQALDIVDAVSGRSDLRTSVIELLEQMSGDSEQTVQQRAARMLVKLGEHSGGEVLMGMLSDLDSEERVELVEFLLEYDAQANLDQIKPIIQQVEMADDADRQRERQLLYELAATDSDDAFFAELRELFTSNDIDDRIAAARSLGRTGHGGALELLSRGLGEGRSDIRRYSARGFGHFGDSETLGELRTALTGESDKEIRLELINTVGQIQDVRATQVLRFLVRDRDPDVRLAVVEALDDIGLPESGAALEMLIQDRDMDVKWAAFLSLLRLDADQARGHVTSLFRNPPNTFGHSLDPHAMPRRAREAVYGEILSHNASRVRTTGVEHATAHRDVLLPVAREKMLDADIHEETRRGLVYLIISERDAEDTVRLEQVVADYSDEPAAEVAAWYLARNMEAGFEELFERFASGDDSPMALIGRLALVNLD